MFPPVDYLRLYSDADGESHFAEGVIATFSRDFAPPAPAFNVSAFASACGCGFLQLPPAWDGDLHPSPIRMWVFLLDGHMEFETSDGEVRAVGPGSALLLEDTSGKGHRSRVTGDHAATMSVVELPPA